MTDAQVLGWDDGDADTAHDPLCMHIMPSDDIVTHYVSLYTFNNCRMAGQIFMKFGMDVMSLETNPTSYLLISYTHHFLSVVWLPNITYSTAILSWYYQ
jgi:hypothetical protein